MVVRSEQYEEDSLANERWLRSCCGADEPAMLVNSGVLEVIRESMVQDSW